MWASPFKRKEVAKSQSVNSAIIFNTLGTCPDLAHTAGSSGITLLLERPLGVFT